MIPKPFARVQVRYSAAARVEATSARDAESEVPRFAELLLAVADADGE